MLELRSFHKALFYTRPFPAVAGLASVLDSRRYTTQQKTSNLFAKRALLGAGLRSLLLPLQVPAAATERADELPWPISAAGGGLDYMPLSTV